MASSGDRADVIVIILYTPLQLYSLSCTSKFLQSGSNLQVVYFVRVLEGHKKSAGGPQLDIPGINNTFSFNCTPVSEAVTWRFGNRDNDHEILECSAHINTQISVTYCALLREARV